MRQVANMALARLHGVSKHYGALRALNGIDLELRSGELLALLGITKQSLGRVVKELEARDYLTTRPGNRDRRAKELRLTDAGRAAESAIFAVLRDTMSRAYTHAGQQAVTGFWQVSEALVPTRDRARVAALGREPG